MIDVISKKQMYDSAITGKEIASKDWNCIIAMFLSSLNVYFVVGYACFMCICLEIAIWLFGTRSGSFWWTQVGNPGPVFLRKQRRTSKHDASGRHKDDREQRGM